MPGASGRCSRCSYEESVRARTQRATLCRGCGLRGICPSNRFIFFLHTAVADRRRRRSSVSSHRRLPSDRVKATPSRAESATRPSTRASPTPPRPRSSPATTPTARASPTRATAAAPSTVVAARRAQRAVHPCVNLKSDRRSSSRPMAWWAAGSPRRWRRHQAVRDQRHRRRDRPQRRPRRLQERRRPHQGRGHRGPTGLLNATVAADGTLGCAKRGVTSSKRNSEGTYEVLFAGDVSGCTFSAVETTTTNAGAVGVQLGADKDAHRRHACRRRRGRQPGHRAGGPSLPGDRELPLRSVTLRRDPQLSAAPLRAAPSTRPR